MKRRELVLAAIGLTLLTPSAWFVAATSPVRHEETVRVSGCELPMTILGPDDTPAKAVLFHGLTANRRTMLQLGRSLAGQMQVFVLDHPGHGDSTQPFTYERAEACAATAVDWLEKRGRIQLDKTVLIGHSMGAGIAIRLADQFPTAATVSISTALRKPVVGNPPSLEKLDLPHRMPVNLFLINAEYDWPELKATSQRMVHAAEGERYASQDFAEKRAIRWQTFAGATHTSLIFDSRVHAALIDWTQKALPGNSSPVARLLKLRLLAISAGLLGPMLMFPLAASLLGGGTGEKQSALSLQPPMWKAPVSWLATGLLAVVLQLKFTTLGPVLRMYSGDYLASVLMIVGVVLLTLRLKWAGQAPPLQWKPRTTVSAVVLGMATMLAFGAWLNWQITDAWLNAPRWWRFAVLVPLVLPYFVAEEIVLGSPPLGWLERAGRFAKFLTLRGILWLAMVFGLWVLGSAQVLMALLVIYMVAFSIAQRAGMDAIRRRTGSAEAAAVFGAILAAWFIAAVFPIT